MTLFKNTNLLNVADHSLNFVFFTPKATVSTDRYKLVEISSVTPQGEHIEGAMHGFKPFLVNPDDLKKIKVDSCLAVKHLDDQTVIFTDAVGATFSCRRVNDKFPDYEKLMTNEGRAEVVLDIKHLQEVLNIAKKIGTNIKIKVGKDTEPVMFTTADGRQNLRALVMPIKE